MQPFHQEVDEPAGQGAQDDLDELHDEITMAENNVDPCQEKGIAGGPVSIENIVAVAISPQDAQGRLIISAEVARQHLLRRSQGCQPDNPQNEGYADDKQRFFRKEIPLGEIPPESRSFNYLGS
jgi:hypothetical protein